MLPVLEGRREVGLIFGSCEVQFRTPFTPEPHLRHLEQALISTCGQDSP